MRSYLGSDLRSYLGLYLRFRLQPRPASIHLTLLALFSATALLATAICGAQARDFEMGGDGNYNIMVPESGTGSRHVVRERHGRTSRLSQTATQQPADNAAKNASSITDTPEQIETFKSNRRATAWRGSSGLVLPTPLPGPTHYAPINTGPGPGIATNPLPREQPPTILPGTGRVIPNLPHGPENFQDRASRCSFQSAINNVPGGQMSNYMHNCAM
jgi:hypothetical protein